LLSPNVYLQVNVTFLLQQKCWIENCGELGPDDDWGVGEVDGTRDVYPPYPADWSIANQQLEVLEFINIMLKSV
jgi:hypothetical protein